MRQGLRTWTLVLAWLAAVLPAHAQEAVGTDEAEPEIPRYAVEIILFRYSRSAAAGNEVFLPDAPSGVSDAGLPEDATGIPEFGDPVSRAPVPATEELGEIPVPAVAVNFAPTPRAQLVLGEVYSQLQRLDAYEPVMWSGWTQDAIEREGSPLIPLRRIGNAPPEFDGTLQLYLSRFLHLVADVTFSERQAAPATVRTERPGSARQSRDPVAAWAPVARMRIAEDRIMKNGDIRYFDHPKFGLLATVTRLEDPADETGPGAGTPPSAD